MVRFEGSGQLDPAKLEIEDSLEEEYGSLTKRSKPSAQFNQWTTGNNEFPIPPTQYNPLDEPSPLGLRLRKSPSLLDLIQMRLSQSNAATDSANLNLIDKKDLKGATASTSSDKLKAGNFDKLKATNFPALLLRIGNWEYVSKYEGDLVAKCYFAKHKIVWEILDGGLKSKIEIQWSDIMALKANLPDDGPGTLTMTLIRPPLFFKETNPQPRKHTLWQAIADFTDGQASIHRQHFLQCTQGLLNKHYQRLIQCDKHLNLVSQHPDVVLDSPYFDIQAPAKGSPISRFKDVESFPAAQTSSKTEGQNSAGLVQEHLSPQAPSPSSVMDLRAIEGNESRVGDDFQVQRSISMSDLVNHIGHKISERINSGNASGFKETLECQDMLENIAQILLGDAQCPLASDEKKLMSRVNSLCCLLQDPNAGPSVKFDCQTQLEEVDHGKAIQGNRFSEPIADVGCNQALGLSRKDSFGDFLLNLPRISSLPKFLFDILEDTES